MKKSLLPKHYVLLTAIVLALSVASYTFMQRQFPEAANTPVPVLDKPVSDKSPLQQMNEITDCAALLAVTESSISGELKADSAMFDLISYALGKSRELEQQAGLEAGAAKASYDEKTVAYFMDRVAATAQARKTSHKKVVSCEKMLREFEPGAQIQSTLDKAREMAREAGTR